MRFEFFVSSSSLPGSTIVGGASKEGEGPGRSRGLGVSVLKGETERPLPDPPKLNGNVGLEDEPDPTLLDLSLGTSVSEEEKPPLRFGLGGTIESLGDASFDGKRGVNECDRVWTGPEPWESGVAGEVPELIGDDAAVSMPLRPGGEEEGVSTLVVLMTGNG